MLTVLARIEGWVQGVFFRKYTLDQALALKISGYVRNMGDGSVETLIQGEDDAVEAMLYWLRQGSPHSKVTGITTKSLPNDPIYDGFTLRS